MPKKVEHVTLGCEPQIEVVHIGYSLSCGDSFEWCDKYPPTFCPYCGRMIDYAGPEVEQ